MFDTPRLKPLDAASLRNGALPGNLHHRYAMNHAMTIRRATPDDGARLRTMHGTTLRELGAGFYSPALIDQFLVEVGTLDDALLADGTCLVIESDGELAASGAWTLRPQALDRARPHAAEPVAGLHRAAIRSVFTAPRFARRGLASTIMRLCETDAASRSLVTHFELYATLSGVPLYQALGYRAVAPVAIDLSGGDRFDAVLMTKPAEEIGERLRTASGHAPAGASVPPIPPLSFIQGTHQ